MFSGDVAFGIAKGINRDEAGRCLFYYYMSTDYLPPPWRLLTSGDAHFAASRSPLTWPEPGTGSAGSLPSFTIWFFSSTWTTRGWSARASASSPSHSS